MRSAQANVSIAFICLFLFTDLITFLVEKDQHRSLPAFAPDNVSIRIFAITAKPSLFRLSHTRNPNGLPLNRSLTGFTAVSFGVVEDIPQPADFDNDGRAELAVLRPSNGMWYLNRSAAGFAEMQFGITTDVPSPADYDGDGRADVAVFRDGIWYLNRSTAGFTGVQFGSANDNPVPNAFVQ